MVPLQDRLEKFWDKHYAKCVVVCYWLFGLCNNFAYVVMLSAAHDILSDGKNSTNSTSNHTTSGNHTNKYDCNEVSTGAILLADILPGITIKILAPFFVHRLKYSVKIGLVVIVNLMSYLIVASTPSEYTALIFFGVCCASLSSSFGELTFLSMSSLYRRELSLSGWGSGTGAAGLIGSFGYAALTGLGLKPRTVILIMVIVPVILIFSYIVLPSVAYTKGRKYLGPDDDGEASDVETDIPAPQQLVRTDKIPPSESISQSLHKVRPLIKYMIPLFLVYFAEYFLNQGLFELLYFKDSSIKHSDQYRWYNVIYQLAVFISRSSIGWIQIKQLWIFPILQLINVFIALSQVYQGYMGSIWFVFMLIMWEGLLGGGCYVNAFNMVSIEIPRKDREFSMGVVSIADGIGIAFAGFSSIPAHNIICKYGNNK